MGMFLSSGVDSTILTGLAAKHTDRLRTFTVGFADQADMSESEPAARTARLMNVEHTDIQITGKDALKSAMAWFEIRDQPSFDGLNTYVISKAVRQAPGSSWRSRGWEGTSSWGVHQLAKTHPS